MQHADLEFLDLPRSEHVLSKKKLMRYCDVGNIQLLRLASGVTRGERRIFCSIQKLSGKARQKKSPDEIDNQSISVVIY